MSPSQNVFRFGLHALLWNYRHLLCSQQIKPVSDSRSNSYWNQRLVSSLRLRKDNDNYSSNITCTNHTLEYSCSRKTRTFTHDPYLNSMNWLCVRFFQCSISHVILDLEYPISFLTVNYSYILIQTGWGIWFQENKSNQIYYFGLV